MAEFIEKYINPFTDYGFKKLFGEELNKDLLLDFLNELLKEEQGQIKDLIYLKTGKLGTTEVDELETRFDKWLYVIRNLNKLDRIPEKLRERIFDKVFETAEIARFTQDQVRSYEDSLKYYRDLRNSLETAKDEKAIEIARNLMNSGISIDIIIKSTGLTRDQIEKLK
jgi:hypothetical protein